jgi:subtilisin family serine protease
VKLLTALTLAVLAFAPVASGARAGAAFTPNDPLFPRQYYLAQDHAFDPWPSFPALQPVLVAVVDSGIDGGHPEFKGRIAAAKSFVGGKALVDSVGHGTFVAGEIAALTGNRIGMAGMAPSARLLVAKAAYADGSVSTHAEALAIRWAVDHGARVINLSLAGVRAPESRSLDTYSAEEAAAIAYATAQGAVVIAAVGNADDAPSAPWPYASWPSALPHVLGVAALTRAGAVPRFSDRDPVFVDLAAPGDEIVSTFPRVLTRKRRGCVNQGYSDCGEGFFRAGAGTSFAAPQASATAAVLLALRPELSADQVVWSHAHSADDVGAPICAECRPGRDSLSGWGRIDVTRAIAMLDAPLPPADVREPNDGATTAAARVYGRTARIDATLDYWDDPLDVYSVFMRAGEQLSVRLDGTPGTETALHVTRRRTISVRAEEAGAVHALDVVVPTEGWYDVRVRLDTEGYGGYNLRFFKS